MIKAIIQIKTQLPIKSKTEFPFSAICAKIERMLLVEGFENTEVSIAPEGYLEDCICCVSPGNFVKKFWTNTYYSVCKVCEPHIVVTIDCGHPKISCNLHKK